MDQGIAVRRATIDDAERISELLTALAEVAGTWMVAELLAGIVMFIVSEPFCFVQSTATGPRMV